MIICRHRLPQQKERDGVCRTEIDECRAHPRDFLENPQSCLEGSFLNPLSSLHHERWKKAVRFTGAAFASMEECLSGQTPPISGEAAAAGASATAGRPGTVNSHTDSNLVPPQPPTRALISVLCKA